MSPETLSDRFTDGTILASYANFGYIPYGQTVMGMIHLDKSNPDACNEFPDTEIKRIGGGTPFMIAARGGCSFVQKIRNMENAGVAAGIVVDNKNENITQILMSDDGTGGGIRIPSMLIGKSDGEKIIDWLSTVNETEHAKMNIMMDFVMNSTKDNRVAYDFWYTSSSDRALDFLEDFAQVEKKLTRTNVDFTPHFVFWQCVNCDSRYTAKDCYGGGKYCAVEPSNRKINGQEIVEEDLR